MTEFVLKNNCFEFNGKVKKQLLGAVIGTKLALTYAVNFMEKFESDLLKFQDFTPLLWYHYNDDVFFIWTHGEEKLAFLKNNFNNYHESNKKHIPFLDFNVKLSGNKLSTDLYIKSTDRHQYPHYTSSH